MEEAGKASTIFQPAARNGNQFGNGLWRRGSKTTSRKSFPILRREYRQQRSLLEVQFPGWRLGQVCHGLDEKGPPGGDVDSRLLPGRPVVAPMGARTSANHRP